MYKSCVVSVEDIPLNFQVESRSYNYYKMNTCKIEQHEKISNKVSLILI